MALKGAQCIQGEYGFVDVRHGAPVYLRRKTAEALDSFIYFHDNRDGPTFEGWWISPEVGGDRVWAFGGGGAERGGEQGLNRGGDGELLNKGGWRGGLSGKARG